MAANASFTESDVKGLSVNSEDELLKSSMETVVSTTVAFVSAISDPSSYLPNNDLYPIQYSVPTFVLFALFYIAAKAIELLLARASTEYNTLAFENKRNTVTCKLNICIDICNITVTMSLRYRRFKYNRNHSGTWLPAS